MSYSDRLTWNGANETFDGATTLVPAPNFVPLFNVLVHRVALKVTNTAAGGISAALFKKRTSTGTDVNLDTVVVPAANVDGNMYYKTLASPVEMSPGDRIIIAVTEGGTAPTAIPVVEYSVLEKPLTGAPASVIASA